MTDISSFGIRQADELKYGPLNVWQIRNCAACAVPEPCKTRENVIEDFEKTGKLGAPLHCLEKVELPP